MFSIGPTALERDFDLTFLKGDHITCSLLKMKSLGDISDDMFCMVAGCLP